MMQYDKEYLVHLSLDHETKISTEHFDFGKDGKKSLWCGLVKYFYYAM